MYVQSPNDGADAVSFRRDKYNIPANYRGNAFTADEIPMAVNDIDENNTFESQVKTEDRTLPSEKCEKETEHGLIRSIFKDTGLNSDDLLILGLLLIFTKNGRDKGSDLLPLLILLLLMG